MLVVTAVGGAALLGPEDRPDLDVQRRNVRSAVGVIGQLADGNDMVVTHGSARQVGLLSVQSAWFPGVNEYPLDAVEAETEGLIGYLFQQELANELRHREVVTLLTQVVVDPDDPRSSAPVKLVGPCLAEVDATRLARDRNWTVVPDGRGFRRAVASPEPLAVVELRTIKRLVGAGVVVVCAGGGGIPVAVDETGALRGVEAVIDKDRSAALLAALLGADVLLLLTDVPAVVTEWGTGFARSLRHASPAELRAMPFAAGSMAPKVEAACRFVERTGKRAAIGAMADAPQVLAGEAGTQITLDPPLDHWYDTDVDVSQIPPSPWKVTFGQGRLRSISG